jgi:hypothetical protein
MRDFVWIFRNYCSPTPKASRRLMKPGSRSLSRRQNLQRCSGLVGSKGTNLCVPGFGHVGGVRFEAATLNRQSRKVERADSSAILSKLRQNRAATVVRGIICRQFDR